jgi:hypothetical protein
MLSADGNIAGLHGARHLVLPIVWHLMTNRQPSLTAETRFRMTNSDLEKCTNGEARPAT